MTRVVQALGRRAGGGLLPALLLVLLPASSALAQSTLVQPLETLPSFRANQVFETGPIDNIGLYSGDAQISVPLGPEYTLSAGLTWRLAAHYSGKLWHMWGVYCGGADECGQARRVTRARLAGYPTLGAGWSLEVGHVIEGSTYFGESPGQRFRSPSGSLAPLGSAPGGYLAPDDGTFVRFSQAPGWRMQRPDGSTWEFDHAFYPPSPPNNYDFLDDDRVNAGILRYGLTQIRDRFNNVVLTVTYAGPPLSNDAWKVQSILLSGGRQIDFTWGTFRGTQPGSQTWTVLQQIRFDGPQGQNLYVNFSRVPDGRFARTPFDYGGAGTCPDSGYPVIDGPLLGQIQVGSQITSFTYDVGDGSGQAGLLKSYTLPTGGRVEYDWQSWTALSPCLEGHTSCDPEVDEPPIGSLPQSLPGDPCSNFRLLYQQFIDSSPAVIARREVDPIQGTNALTTYVRKQYGGRAGPNELDDQRVVRQVVVSRPDGNNGRIATKHIFAVNPFGRTGAELERRSYEDDIAGGSPVRTEIFCYATDPTSGVCGVMDANETDGTRFHHVVFVVPEQQTKHVTWYGVNPRPGASCSENYNLACRFVSRSGWVDEAREYGLETVGIEYNGTGPNYALVQESFLRRETSTNWIPDFVTGAWMPKIFNSRTVADVYSPTGSCPNPPCQQTTTYSYDSQNGNLLTKSISDTRAGYTATASASYSYEGGNPTQETVSGSGALSGSISTTRTFVGNLGLMTKAKRSPFTYYSFDVDRDDKVGLITTSRDANNTLTTAYSWDALGRLTAIAPPGEQATSVCYTNFDGVRPAWVLLKKGTYALCSTNDGSPSEGSGPIDAYGYDGLGRLSREIKKLPNSAGSGNLAVRISRYNDAGYLLDKTEWQPCNSNDVLDCLTVAPSANRTVFSNFDFLGRWRHRQGPDGSRADRTFDDPIAPIANSDFTELTTLYDINAVPGSSGGLTASLSKRSDLLGRPVITGIPGDAPYGPLTFEKWNVLDKLTETRQPRPDGLGDQIRKWDYDTLGNLRSETHPETGTTATTYTSFDVFGNVLSKTLPGSIALTSTYDTLGRALLLRHGATTYQQSYYDGNGFAGGTYKLGKLTRQVTYNRSAFFENAWVEDDFTYSGLGGRVSARTTRVRRAAGGIVLEGTQGFTWNALGLLATHGHPRPGGSPWNVDTFYTVGFPTRVVAGGQTVVSSALYSAFGGLKQYTTGDGVQTNLTPDSSGLPRPVAISTAGVLPASLNFNSGTISYDGVGNVRQMYRVDLGKTDAFTYDKAGRLRIAAFGTLGSGVTDEFIYDGTTSGIWTIGNLTSRLTDGSSVALNVNQATNRLASGAYDARGNMTSFGPKVYDYDALSRQVRFSQTGTVEHFLYGAADERVARIVPTASVPELPRATRFFKLNPCRLIDTRSPASPLVPGVEKTVQASGVCGIPSNATALSANVTSINFTGDKGFIRAYPSGLSDRPLTNANAVAPGRIRGVFNIINVGGPDPGRFKLLSDMPTANIDAIVDVSGYFAPFGSAPTGNSWYLTLRDSDHRLMTEFRWDQTANKTTLLTDHVYLGSTRVATLGTTQTPSVPSGLTFYSTDHLGSARLAHGEGGTVLGVYRYRSFGQPFTGTSTPQGVDFAAMERDTSSGDHYDHARFYSGYTGRFNIPDKLTGRPEDPASFNRYAYARNNPLKYVDPDGDSAGLGPAFRDNILSTARVLYPIYGRDPSHVEGDAALAGGIAGGAALVAAAPLAASAGVAGGAATVSSSVFRMAPILRGRVIESILGAAGGSLPANFPTIDRFLNGVATSVKSIDLSLKTYQAGNALFNRVAGFIDKLAGFSVGRVGDTVVRSSQVTTKVLELVVPRGATPEQLEQLQKAARYAQAQGVVYRLIEAQ